MRRSLSRQQPQVPRKPDLQNIRIHSLPKSTVLELLFKDGMTLTLAFPPDQAEKLGEGLKEGAAKSRAQKVEH